MGVKIDTFDGKGNMLSSVDTRTDEDIKYELRNQRKWLLDEADYEINKREDNGQDATTWRAYRDSLRGITDAADLKAVSFPSKPDKYVKPKG